MSAPYQVMPPLADHTEAALRCSIDRFGVLVPVTVDQHGNVLDGHHRRRIADELKVNYRVDVVNVTDAVEAREIARTLNADRRHLTEDQRREVVGELRRDGHSVRAIADAVGVSKSTIDRDVTRLSHAGQLEQPDEVTGLDGKRRPSTRPLVVATRNHREAERARSALATLADDAPDSGVLDVRRVGRLARQVDFDRRRAQPVEPVTVHGDIDIRHGDLRSVLADVPDGSVDAIVTDPPYAAEYVPLYADLGEAAGRLLAPDGVLAVLHGHAHLCAQRHNVERHLDCRWPCAYLLTGPSASIHSLRLDVAWKPLNLYTRPGAKLPAIGNDLFRSGGADKSHHEWGQSESGMADVVSRLTKPGDVVVDPFVGGGTTAVVCRDLGRRFVGCDTDAAAVATTRSRVAEHGGAA